MTRIAALLALILVGACHTMPNSGLAHDVYFELRDSSPGARQRLIDSCYEKLAPIAGITFFAAGDRDAELTRPVNDQAFHVALHVYFVDRAAHDAYQDDPAHLAFIEDNLANWKSVRVFDAGFGR
ncbi:MAG: Dabb family protein [Planctomycetota bacterium]|nr:Dabb family protein [Planctomycetota bacterium]